jgi:hypothetical protein
MRAPYPRGPRGPGLQLSLWDFADQAEDLAGLGSVAIAPVDGAETAVNDDLFVGDVGIGDVHGVRGQWRVVWQVSERCLELPGRPRGADGGAAFRAAIGVVCLALHW